MLGLHNWVAVLLGALLLLSSSASFASPPSPQNQSIPLVEPTACACPLELRPEAAGQTTESPPLAAATSRRPKTPTVIVLNLRQASARQLEWLPRIGPASAQRILEFRRRKPLLNIGDLAKIKGIGKKTVALLRPWLTVSGPSLLCPVSCDHLSVKTDLPANQSTVTSPIAPEFSSCQDHLPLAPAG